ncbi:MAG: hypothetical protein KJ749_08070 [Planctomycetes bacterium]|nr:hypothetical protein [Planctomycetota bacterium]
MRNLTCSVAAFLGPLMAVAQTPEGKDGVAEDVVVWERAAGEPFRDVVSNKGLTGDFRYAAADRD